MNKEKRRLIDDEIVVGLIYYFETEEWGNGIMEEGIHLTSKPILDQAAIELSIPVLDLANKTALPKTPQP
jgi:hypothetical protein